MRKLTLRPVQTRPAGVTEKEFKAAQKIGEIECNAVTAVENLRNSGGLYEIKPEPKQQVEIVAKDPEFMTAAELVGEMTAFGKPPRKRMSKDTAIAFVKELRAKAAEMIGDGELDVDQVDVTGDGDE